MEVGCEEGARGFGIVNAAIYVLGFVVVGVDADAKGAVGPECLLLKIPSKKY
jgi:hypothetical protein